MSGEVRVSPISMRIENLNLGQLIRKFDQLTGHGISYFVPTSLTAYVDGKPVTFMLNYLGDKPTITMSSDDPAMLGNLSAVIKEKFRGN